MLKQVIGVVMVGLVALVVGLLIVGAISLLSGFIFMLLWNFVPVDVFSAPELSFWQAWGAMYLVNVIGGAFKSHVNMGAKS